MKTTSPSLFKLTLALAGVLVLFAGSATTALADRDDHPRGQWDSRHHYRRDNYGYYDSGNRYHHYIFYHNHHGYWDTVGPVRVFINVD
jgi:hypothetical protein